MQWGSIHRQRKALTRCMLLCFLWKNNHNIVDQRRIFNRIVCQ